MADLNIPNSTFKMFGNGNEPTFNIIHDRLDHGMDLSLVGASGDGSFNVGLTLRNWVDSLSGGSRNHVIAVGDSNGSPVFGGAALKAALLSISGQADGGPGFRYLSRSEFTISSGWVRQNAGANVDVAPYGDVYSSANQADLITWTLPGGLPAHNRFVIWIADDDFLGQVAQYSLNGGAFTNMPDPSPTTVPAIAASQEVVGTVTTTLRMRPPGNGFPTYVCGISLYNGTTGLVFNDLTKGGGDLSQYVGPQITSGDRLDLFDRLQPKLTLVWTGTNESGSLAGFGLRQMSLDEFYWRYTRLAARARLYGDALIVFPHDSGPNTDPPEWHPASMSDFERVARAVAWENGCGFLSIRQRFGPYAQVNARGFMSDVAHLTGPGLDLARTAIVDLLTDNS